MDSKITVSEDEVEGRQKGTRLDIDRGRGWDEITVHRARRPGETTFIHLRTGRTSPHNMGYSCDLNMEETVALRDTLNRILGQADEETARMVREQVIAGGLTEEQTQTHMFVASELSRLGERLGELASNLGYELKPFA